MKHRQSRRFVKPDCFRGVNNRNSGRKLGMIHDFVFEITFVAHPGELEIGKRFEGSQRTLDIGIGRMVASETIDDDFNHGKTFFALILK